MKVKKIIIDRVKLSKFLISAINNDSSDAILLYADMLHNRDEITPNKKGELKYYQMIVEKGNEKEMLIYGKILFKGVKTAENKRKAIEYCKKCAYLDIEEAIF